MAELLSLTLAVGPLRFDACLNWGSDCAEAQPMLMAPPEAIDMPELDDDDLADGLGFRPRSDLR
jgi:hypothetical protein